MRVNDQNTNPAGLNSTAAGATGTGGVGKTAQLDAIQINSSGAQGARGTERGDEVQLSGLSSKINELQSGTAERAAYLEGLRLQVSSGQYPTEPAAIASSIVDSLLTKSE